MEDAVKRILEHIGEKPDREGLLKTPARVRRAYEFMCQGYRQDPKAIVNGALFSAEGAQDLVICKDIHFFSMCEHHLLPFFGRCHVAYVPREKIVGLSKMPRIIDVFSRRLQVQERLTEQIADAMEEIIQPRGVGVVIQSLHLCVAMRGVEEPHAMMVTRALRGVVKDDPQIRQEFLRSVELSANTILS